MGGFVDVDALLKQLAGDLKEHGRGTGRPDEILGFVRAAAEKLINAERRQRFPIGAPVCTNAIAGESPQRGVRSVKRGT